MPRRNAIPSGARFERVQVIADEHCHRVRCICDCGTNFTTARQSLRIGATRSCGCLRRDQDDPVIPGQRFARLLVLSGGEGKHVLCRCDCGSELTACRSDLRNGRTKSCGCYARTRMTTHGGTGTPEYSTWCRMIDRCEKRTNKDFARYGGRGITVCERWRRSFEAFRDDMGARPNGHSIDRIDNDGNYEPGNCRWVTQQTQVRNSSKMRMIEHDGETRSMIEWAERLGIKTDTLRLRLNRGLSFADAIRVVPYGERKRE